MTTPKILSTILIAILLAAGSVYAAHDAADGKAVVGLKIGDSNCELIDGQIRCTLGK
jgi:type 1 fimbria pilin